MRSTVAEPVRSSATATSSDEAPSEASKPLAGFGEAVAQNRAGGIKVLGDAVVSVRDCVADPAAAGHDRLPLIGHFGDQQANLALVVGIGALEGRNL